jgi:hypothetical protein
MPTAAKASINKSKIETVPHWLSANSKTPKAPFSRDAAAERVSDKNPAMISRRVNGLPQKGREFDYLGQITRLYKNRQGIALVFRVLRGYGPAFPFRRFEADLTNRRKLPRRGETISR